MAENNTISLYKRIETEIANYINGDVEISEGVRFSQYKTIKRIYKFRNRDLAGSKINPDLSYNYYFDIISPRVDSEMKNLRFDTKHIVPFSRNPIKDFAAVFVANATLKNWMAEHGEDEKLKASVEEFCANGNIGFKRIKKGYEIVDPRNTYITNQLAQSIDDSDVIERHEMSASELKSMSVWDQNEVDKVIKDCKNKSFRATASTAPVSTTSAKYEVYEFTGEVSEKEYNAVLGLGGGDENVYLLAKIVLAGLTENGNDEKHVLFADRLIGKISDQYLFSHRGRYEGRFWRIGMYELLFDHQIRANEIGNQLATGLEWASRVIFRSKDSKILQNIRADLDNGDVVIAEDLAQVDVRLHNLDQLIADWNRLIADADRLSNSFEIVRGENMPSGTPFRAMALMDQNAGMLFSFLRQKITLVYKRVFREWVLPDLLRSLKGEDIFTLTGDKDMLDQLRGIMVDRWYVENLVKIGPHTQEVAAAIKADKLKELQDTDPTIENTKDIWTGLYPRMFITITGENSDLADQVTDLMTMVGLEKDPDRIAWILDQIYRIRNIPIPPRKPQPTPNGAQNAMQQMVGEAQARNNANASKVGGEQGGQANSAMAQ